MGKARFEGFFAIVECGHLLFPGRGTAVAAPPSALADNRDTAVVQWRDGSGWRVCPGQLCAAGFAAMAGG
jgi:hypothetical protein